jgi:glycosyltransferase involved in cell wall biosynthesis
MVGYAVRSSELGIVSRSAFAGRTSDTLVFAPTYNERETIAILALPEKCDVLILDDCSRDGTTEFLIERSATEPRLRVITRPGKFGVGSAHKVGWLQARQHGYSRLITLDADLSHDPQDVSRLLALLDDGADVAFGSRFLPGGRLDYSGWRLFLSRNANRLARLLLDLPMTEYTNSLRAVCLERVPPGLVENVADDGYAFFVTCAARLARHGLTIREIPIHFRDRQGGVSKISKREILRAMIALLWLTFDRRAVTSSLTDHPDDVRMSIR